VSGSTIRRAARVLRIEMVEAEVSIWARDIFSNDVAQTCKELGIVICAHSPL
jgi:pyridoxine 4-dehydrogenase